MFTPSDHSYHTEQSVSPSFMKTLPHEPNTERHSPGDTDIRITSTHSLTHRHKDSHLHTQTHTKIYTNTLTHTQRFTPILTQTQT